MKLGLLSMTVPSSATGMGYTKTFVPRLTFCMEKEWEPMHEGIDEIR